jgi:hypothetical protein
MSPLQASDSTVAAARRGLRLGTSLTLQRGAVRTGHVVTTPLGEFTVSADGAPPAPARPAQAPARSALAA